MNVPVYLITVVLCNIGTVLGGQPIITVPANGYVTVQEEKPIGTLLFTFNAYDPDPSHDLSVFTSNAMANTYANLTITGPGFNRTVEVKTKHRLDKEAHSTKLTFEFTANDGHFGTETKSVDVYLENINDNPPVLSPQSYRWEIPELPWNNNTVYMYTDIQATDADKNNFNIIEYSMEPNSQSEAAKEEYNNTFSIDKTSGNVTLLKPLDYSTNSFYQFTVYARNPSNVVAPGESNFTKADLIISVLDRQNKPPFFTGIPYRQEISENALVGTSVLPVTALDGDTGLPNNVNYTIEDGPCSSFFDISASGLITTSSEIDRDAGNISSVGGVCVLNILVQEIENRNYTQFGKTNATTDVTITIKDMNDNSPKFSNTTYYAEIQENAAKNIPIILTSVLDITVSDADAEPEYTRMDITLKYGNGSDCPDFVASPQTVRKSGSVIIKVHNSDLLDYERVQNITLLIIAQETSNTSHIATSTVSLTILDMNDNNPQFQNDSYAFTIAEASDTNYTVGYINAIDEDSGLFGSVVYKLSGGNNRFGVEEDTGRVYTNCSKCSIDLDRERVDVYYMTVTATDMNGTSGARSDSTSLMVRLRDVNDNAPQFTRTSPIQVYIDENDSRYNETALVQIQANDIDAPHTNNSVVRYKLETVSQPSMANNVTVNETTGKVFLTQAVDFENLNGTGDKRTIEIVITAYDLGEPPQKNNITVDIEVQDMNDNSPIFTNTTFNGSVFENQSSNESYIVYVGNASAEDADGSVRNRAINYYIISGSSDRFTINSMTGQISIQLGAKLDRETTPNYTMTIMAIDQGSPPRNTTAKMIVDVLDINDEIPAFNQSAYAVSTKENMTESVGEIIFTCNVTDKDLNDDLNYSMDIVSAANEDGKSINITHVQNYFGIHANNGSVYTNSGTDRETAEIIVIRLHVEDLNADFPSPQTATAMLTATLLDINDNIPKFSKELYNMSVSENALDGTRLEAVTATDRDINRTITYSILDDTSLHFDIDPITGTITKTGFLDREMNASITFEVVAYDNGVPKLNSTSMVNVTLIDFNDNAPLFMMNITTATIEEHCENATSVITVTASDDDEGRNAEIKYSCSNCPPYFAINSTTGLITTMADIDREEQSIYELHIEAKDNPENAQEQKSTTVTITVTIADKNDNAPQFSKNEFTATVREDAVIGTAVSTVMAEDKDEPNTNNSKISFTFFNNTTPSGLFIIDKDFGVITTNASLKNQYGIYVIHVLAEDHGTPKLGNSTVVKIDIIDINLNNPVITNPPVNSTIKIVECTELGFELYHFNYSDLDKGNNSEAYFNISKIQESDNIAVFHLHPNGSLTLKQKLNYTIQNEYKFQISVTDKGSPPLSSDKMTINVKIIDVNDHRPSFSSDLANMSVAENQPENTRVGKLNAIDPDSDSTSCYKIVEGPWASSFAVGNTTGEILTKTTFDRENTSYSDIAFNVTVRDCSIFADTGVACANNTADKDKNVIDTVKVNVKIADANDNPPMFINEEIVTGMRRTTEVGTILEINLKDKQYVSDLDSDDYGYKVWKFRNNGTITSSNGITIPSEGGALPCADSKTYLFCISENGSIINNKYFPEDLSGFFVVPISVHDGYGSDVANLKIFLISDSQILIMVILGSKEEVSKRKDDVLRLYSEITGHAFVYDGIADHKTASGGIDPLKTDLYFHVVEPNTQAILSTEQAIRLIDENALRLQEAMRQYSVIEVVSSQPLTQEEDNKGKTIIILAAVVAVLAVTVIIIVYVAVSTRLKYQRKLKAATIVPEDEKTIVANNPIFVPGSNVYSKQSNPLLNSEVPVVNDVPYDGRSLSSNNSLDENDVGDIRQDYVNTRYDSFEEREVRMDLFSDDSRAAKDVESPLDAALRLHSMHAEANMQNEFDNALDSDGNTEETGLESVTLSGIDNDTFEGDLESTEI